MARPHRKNPLPPAPPKRSFGAPPPKQVASSLERVRKLARDLPENERPFDPARAPTWRGSSRDLVVNGRDLDSFTTGFLNAALFSTNDESRDDGGDPLDENYSIGDFDPKSLAGLAADCARFQEENAYTLAGFDDAESGADFWFTRCGHGVGFWDGDYPEPQATELTNASKAFGNVDLYVGDDGLIYAMGYEDGPRQRRNGEQQHFPWGSKRAGKLELRMKDFDWEQVDGDVNLGAHGGIIARCEDGQIDLVEIQPVREYVGDSEAQEVGYPFWIKEASYTVDELDPGDGQVKSALRSSDVDLEEVDDDHLVVAIALACFRYGVGVDEAGGGWAGHTNPGEEGDDNLLGSRKVRWGYAGTERKTFAEECSDEDDEFRLECLARGYTYKIAYEVVTPESAEDGEAEERGWEVEESEEYATLADVLGASDIRHKSWLEWSDSRPSARSWLSSEADQDFETGADTTYDLWIMHSDGTPLNDDEIQIISQQLGVRI